MLSNVQITCFIERVHKFIFGKEIKMSRNNKVSDSDSSDEDFCPDNNEELGSEEESGNDTDENSDFEPGKEVVVEKNRNETKRRQTTASRNSQEKRQEENDDEKTELKSDDEDKQRVNSLWNDFLSEVKTETVATSTKTTDELKVKPSEAQTSAKASPGLQKKLNLATDSFPATRSVPILKRGRPSFSGISAVLNSSKKTKKSVLESTLEDWNHFKKDEEIADELEEHNKGKNGYLDRQDFLQRTDLRQFEIEKNLRRSRCKQ